MEEFSTYLFAGSIYWPNVGLDIHTGLAICVYLTKGKETLNLTIAPTNVYRLN